MNRLSTVGLVLALFACGSGSAAHAQAVNGGTNRGIVPFLENTDVFLSNRDDLVFEAHLFPHLLVMQNFTDAFDLQESDNRKFFYILSGTPAVRLRMFNDVSRPVRTPSYMPRGNLQFLIAPRLVRAIKDAVMTAEADRAAGRPRRIASRDSDDTGAIRMLALHAIVSHHSNGQDGCLYTDEQRGDDGECFQVAGEAHEINKRDGSFSTNFVRLGANMRWYRVDEDAFPVLERTLRAEVQWHPRVWTSDRIEDQYGRFRFLAGATIAWPDMGWCNKSLGVSTGLEWISLGRPENVDPVALTGTVSCHPATSGGWGLFARIYSGQDYYNLGFRDNIRSLQVGFTYSSDGFFRFASSRNPN